MPATIRHGDALEILPTISDNSISAIVTDPPYHLVQASRNGSNQPGDLTSPHGRCGPSDARGFMGKTWDGGDIAFRPDVWRECLRVLKPGGYLAAFGGSRTHHRLWCAIEDAGFEIRDTLMWLHAQGFPKSSSVSKSIDKHLGAEREVIGTGKAGTGLGLMDKSSTIGGEYDLTTAATPEAEQWAGWGTALKPAHEPICLARKPIQGTVAENTLAYGCGGLNIDASRVGTATETHASRGRAERNGFIKGFVSGTETVTHDHGRWPPNLLHDGSDDVMALFPKAGGGYGIRGRATRNALDDSLNAETGQTVGYGDEGSAARFFPSLGYSRAFYCAKASRADRAGSKHPTVKPVKLIEWLVRLTCPPGGIILDPFAGSGTTGEACNNLGFDSILIEREIEYITDCNRRLLVSI